MIKQIGQRIEQLRKKHNITRNELAKKLNLSVMQLYRIEKGIVPPTCYILMNLCNIFQVQPSYFLNNVMTPYHIIHMISIPIIGELNNNQIVIYNTISEYIEVEAMATQTNIMGLKICNNNVLSFLQENDILVVSESECVAGDWVVFCKNNYCQIYQIDFLKEGIVLTNVDNQKQEEKIFIAKNDISKYKILKIHQIIRRIK